MTKNDWLKVALASVWESDDHQSVSVAFVKALLLALDEADYIAQEPEQFNTIQIGPIVELEDDLIVDRRLNSKKRKHLN